LIIDLTVYYIVWIGVCVRTISLYCLF